MPKISPDILQRVQQIYDDYLKKDQRINALAILLAELQRELDIIRAEIIYAAGENDTKEVSKKNKQLQQILEEIDIVNSVLVTGLSSRIENVDLD
jgi:hypothetical protein